MTKETNLYVNAMKMVGLSLAADVENLIAQKKDTEKVLANLGKHNSLETIMRNAISEFDS